MFNRITSVVQALCRALPMLTEKATFSGSMAVDSAATMLNSQCRSFASRSSKASGSFAVNRNANVDSTVHEKVDEVKSSALKTVAALQNTTSDPAQLAMLESLEIKIKDLRLRDEHVLLNHRELKSSAQLLAWILKSHSSWLRSEHEMRRAHKLAIDAINSSQGIDIDDFQQLVVKDRSGSIRQYLQTAWARFSHHVSDKKQNPLIATQASPGMGNSTFIDVLAMLSFQQIKELSPAQSTDAFHRSVAESVCVTVDYNGYQGVFPFDQKNAVVGFSLRILHSYFCGMNIPFDNFLRSFRQDFVTNLDLLTPSFAIDVICEHHCSVHGTSTAPWVRIFVDETRVLASTFVSSHLSEVKRAAKIAKSQQLKSVLLAIGNCISSKQKCHFLLTALETSTLTRTAFESGRKIQYVGLMPLQSQYYRKMFQKLPIYRKSAEIRGIVASLNGHPRHLVNFFETLQSFPKGMIPSRSTLIEYFAALMESPDEAVSVPADAITKAILQETVEDMNAPIAVGTLPYSYFIAQGILQQSLQDKSGVFVPRMAPILLELLLKKNPRFFPDEISESLLHMISLESNFGWRSWEKFLAHYFSLISNLHAVFRPATTHLSLRNIFRDFTALDAAIETRSLPMVARSVLELPRQLASPSLNDSRQYANRVIVPAHGNPGYDIAMPYADNEWLLIEARYSAKQGNVTVQDIKEKYKLVLDNQLSLSENQRMKNWILVLMCMRDKTPSIAELEKELPADALCRVVVLNREQLLSMFGPSFRERSRLFVDESRAFQDDFAEDVGARLELEAKKRLR